VADRIKSKLSEASLDHVLTAEDNDWLQCYDLADMVDIYLANYTHEGQPKLFKTTGITNPGKANFSTPEVHSHLRFIRREDGMPATVVREVVAVMLTRMVALYKNIMLLNPLTIPMLEIRIWVLVTFANRRIIGN
jgi:hypothetical protein